MTSAAIPYLLAAQVGLQAFQGKRAHDLTRKQEQAATRGRIRAKQLEEAKAALRIQGIQEQSTELDTKDPFSDTGGIPLSIKQRLTIKDSGVTT